MTAGTLTDRDIEHRREFAEYATRDSASDWHRGVLDRLYRHWVSINGDHFAGACVAPVITLLEPKSPRLLGEYDSIGGHGEPAEIRIRPSLVTGKFKALREGDEFAEGRMRFVEDVLLYAAVRQYCGEALHDDERSYKGHGPVFAGECNRIGDALGLPHVRLAKARGPLKDRPSCADWPHCVRPADYYLGAVADPEPKREAAPTKEADTFPCPLDPTEAMAVIAAHFDAGGLGLLGAWLIGRAVWHRVDREGADRAEEEARVQGMVTLGIEVVFDKMETNRRLALEMKAAEEGRPAPADGDKAEGGSPCLRRWRQAEAEGEGAEAGPRRPRRQRRPHRHPEADRRGLPGESVRDAAGGRPPGRVLDGLRAAVP
jgi:hypothetical protein